MGEDEMAAYAAQVFRNRRAALIAKAQRNPSGDELTQLKIERDKWIQDINQFFDKVVNIYLKSRRWVDEWQGVKDLKYLLAWAQGLVDEDKKVLFF